MKWLAICLVACGSSPPRDQVSERVAGLRAVAKPFTLEVMELDAGGFQVDRAKRLTAELRAAARAYTGVTMHASGKRLVDLQLRASCEVEAPRCMATVVKALPADRMIYGRLERDHVELRMAVADAEAIRVWTSDLLGAPDDAGLRVTAREAMEVLLAR